MQTQSSVPSWTATRSMFPGRQALCLFLNHEKLGPTSQILAPKPSVASATGLGHKKADGKATHNLGACMLPETGERLSALPEATRGLG